MKTVRLVEVAERVGVSPTTISRVINNSPIPSRETREKVLEVIEELNYRPNLMASNLAKGDFRRKPKTGNIAFLTSGIPQSAFLSDGFYSRIFWGIEQTIKEKKHHLIFSTLDIPSEGSILPSVIQEMKVDGALIEAPVSEKLLEWITEFVPAVLVNYYLKKARVSSVMPNNSQGIYEAVSYLYRLGHRKIGFFGVRPLGVHAGPRFKAYLTAIREMGLVEKDDYIKTPDVNSLTGKLEDHIGAVIKQLSSLRQAPTALICAGDGYALAFLKEARLRGLRIPEDLSLTGFDDKLASSHSHPGLTTIRVPMEEMGRAATNLLFDRIENPAGAIKSVVLDVELVPRGSCAPPGKNRFA